MRSIIIGDIHGCDRELCALLEKVQPGKEDRIILLGICLTGDRTAGKYSTG